ncbi:MAG: amidohydrolase family protein [Clostridiales bacterium]|nr:amidohydrolase family protein [Clostridiales bacterium]
MKIVDAHMHLFTGNSTLASAGKIPDRQTGDRMAQAIRQKNTVEFIASHYREIGISGGIVMGTGDLETQGEDLPDGYYYCVGLTEVPLKQLGASLELIERHLRRETCVGIKLYPGYFSFYPSDTVFCPVYKLLLKYGKVLVVHTGQTASRNAKLKYARPIYLDEIAVDFPDLKIVMCHFGNPFLAEAAAVLEKNPNVYADLSGLLEGPIDMELLIKNQERYLSSLREWICYGGDSRKFMFGTDWPAVSCVEYINFIKEIVPSSWWANVFSANAERIYSLL